MANQIPKVHYQIQYKLGHAYSACSRVDPRYITSSVCNVNCKTCLSRIDVLLKLPNEVARQQMLEWVDAAVQGQKRGRPQF